MSQSEKFFNLYYGFKKNMKYITIPSKNTYEDITKYLITNQSDSSNPYATLKNWHKTYLICELEGKVQLYYGGIVIKPILEKDYADRYQADLIDMQSQKDGLFSWILVVQVCDSKKIKN